MKAVSRSVSLPALFWDAIEKHAPTTAGHDRSGYIRSLVETDLAAAGKLPSRQESESADLRAELIALGDELGLSNAVETVRAKLRETGKAA